MLRTSIVMQVQLQCAMHGCITILFGRECLTCTLADAGESVAKYIRQTSPYNTQIVALGIDTYLKMLLHDNFVVSLTTLNHCRNLAGM